jgi:hypothetical protein
VSFYVSTATFFLLHCDEWDRVVALPRHKFVTGATLLQLHRTLWEIPIKIFLFETICSIRTKCWWNSRWMVLFQKYVRRFGPSTKMAPTAKLSLTWEHMGNSHKNLLVWNQLLNWNHIKITGMQDSNQGRQK